MINRTTSEIIDAVKAMCVEFKIVYGSNPSWDFEIKRIEELANSLAGKCPNEAILRVYNHYQVIGKDYAGTVKRFLWDTMRGLLDIPAPASRSCFSTFFHGPGESESSYKQRHDWLKHKIADIREYEQRRTPKPAC